MFSITYYPSLENAAHEGQNHPETVLNNRQEDIREVDMDEDAEAAEIISPSTSAMRAMWLKVVTSCEEPDLRLLPISNLVDF